ncbi:MAG: hypothetical protein ACRD3G_10565 [Vicinamibacterales bacterium]
MRDIGSVTAAQMSMRTVRLPRWTPWNDDPERALEDVTLYRPTTIAETVWIVKTAEDAGRSVHAVGSAWSFTGAAFADRRGGAGPILVDMSMSRLSGGQIVETPPEMLIDTLRPQAIPESDTDTRLMLATAGTRLATLNQRLWGMGFAMPTLGGSQGQRLGGAFGTGVHGSDFDHADVTEVVRAIHLVGAGAAEYWIERGGSRAVTDDQSFQSYPLAAPDARNPAGPISVIRDDDVFFSALVACGRFGIHYAYLLAVPRRYALCENRTRRAWEGSGTTIRSRLERAARDAASYQTEFATPLSTPLPTPLPTPATPVGSRPEPASELRGLIVTIDPYARDVAYVSQRWEVVDQNRPVRDITWAGPKLRARSMASKDTHIIRLAQQVFNDPASGVFHLLAFNQALLALGPVASPILPLLPPVPFDPISLGVFAITFAASHNDIWAAIARKAFEGQQPGHVVFDRSYYVTSGPPPEEPATYDQYFADFEASPKVWGLEYFFDATSTRYLDFVRQVLDAWRGVLGGFVSLRFTTTQSRAMLGLNVFPAGTVAVEIGIIMGFRDSERVKDEVVRLATTYRCAHHWGQDGDRHTALAVQEIYGGRVSAWRRALVRLSRSGNPTTFSNAFTRRLGLEPSPALMIECGSKLRLWLRSAGPNGDVTATRGLVAVPEPGSLVFQYRDEVELSLLKAGPVAHVQIGSVESHPSALLIHKGDRLVACIGGHKRGLQVSMLTAMPSWADD